MPPADDFSTLAAFALELAASAREHTLPLWESGCAAESKGSGAFDPVTEADRGAEKLLRDLIGARFPDHGISGEEYGDKVGAGPLSWSLDPIDGTRSFICRLPTWVTLIALLDEGRPVLGVIDAPCLGETYVGSEGEAWLHRGGERRSIRTSGCRRLADARFSTTDPFVCGPPSSKLEALLKSVKVARYGHDGYAYARLAAGSIDLVIEGGLQPHDYDALIPVVSAAGGHIGDWRGGIDFRPGEVIAAATRELYDEAVALLA